MRNETPKKELVVHVGIYLTMVVLVSFLWPWPWILLGAAMLMGGWMLWRWHERSDLIFFAIGFILGPLFESTAVYFGAWVYARPISLVPVWLPWLWGMAALFMKRLCETLQRLQR